MLIGDFCMSSKDDNHKNKNNLDNKDSNASKAGKPEKQEKPVENDDGITGEKIQVKVLEAKPKDVGLGEAHIDHAVLDKLKLHEGEFIFLLGKKTSVAIVKPGYPEDVGKNTLRIDGNIRRNIDIAVGESVNIAKAELPPAQFISFTCKRKLFAMSLWTR